MERKVARKARGRTPMNPLTLRLRRFHPKKIL
jgi:hypothetical protein